MKHLVPESVCRMIRVHTSYLLKTIYFSYDDKEDITQELCLFYIEEFVCSKKNTDNNLIFHVLKCKALNMLKSKTCEKRNCLKANSYEEMKEYGFDISANDTLEDFERKIDIQNVIEKLNKREQTVCHMFLNGANLEKISKELKMSKHTIYKIFESLKKYFIF